MNRSEALPPELQFSALLASLRSKPTDTSASSQSNAGVFLLQRPGNMQKLQGSGGKVRRHSRDLSLNAYNSRNEVPSRPKSRLESPLPASQPTSNTEKLLNEQLVAADRVAKELFRRNKELERRLEQGKEHSHVSCGLKEQAVRLEIEKLKEEIGNLQGKMMEKPGLDREFLREREEDTGRYRQKYSDLREKLQRYLGDLDGKEASALVREMQETDREHELYVRKVREVRGRQWVRRNAAALEED